MVLRASSVAFAASALVACGAFAANENALDGGSTAPTDAGAVDAGGDVTGGDADASAARSASYEAIVKGDGPTAYWRFAEGAGSITTSTVGEAFILVVQKNGPSFEPTGLFGANSRSMRFADTTTTALAEDSFERVKLVGPGTFALEAWVELGATADTPRWIIQQGSSSTSYGMFVDASGFGAEVIVNGGLAERVVSQGGIAPGWHHVVTVRNGPPLLLWVDGVRATAPLGALADPQNFSASFFVGGRTQTTGLLPNGTRIAEVAIYDHELDDAQVAEHYAAGFSR